jgi:hypothetical protein
LVVEQLVASSNAITVVIKNIGGLAVVDAFWVDVYLNPNPVPTMVNQQWFDVGSEGLVWGVMAPALPLAPTQSLTLTLNDASYVPQLSNFGPPLAPGTPVYAQVDAVNLLTTYGGVLESHAISGGAYNNISGTLSISGSVTLPSSSVPTFSAVEGSGLPARGR